MRWAPGPEEQRAVEPVLSPESPDHMMSRDGGIQSHIDLVKPAACSVLAAWIVLTPSLKRWTIFTGHEVCCLRHMQSSRRSNPVRFSTRPKSKIPRLQGATPKQKRLDDRWIRPEARVKTPSLSALKNRILPPYSPIIDSVQHSALLAASLSAPCSASSPSSCVHHLHHYHIPRCLSWPSYALSSPHRHQSEPDSHAQRSALSRKRHHHLENPPLPA